MKKFNLIFLIIIFLLHTSANYTVKKSKKVEKDTIFKHYKSGKKYKDNNIKAIEEYLKEDNNNINLQNKHGRTLLNLACKRNDTTIAKLLIESGADVNIKDNENNTPIHFAAKNYNTTIAKLLIKSGADVNIINKDKHFPIDEAILGQNKNKKNVSMVKLLIKNKTNIKDNPQALMLASKGNNTKIMEQLINAGANVNAIEKNIKLFDKGNALFYAAYEGAIDACNLLIEKGININFKNEREKNALYIAIQRQMAHPEDKKLNQLKKITKILIENKSELTNEDLNQIQKFLYFLPKETIGLLEENFNFSMNKKSNHGDSKSFCAFDN